MDAEDDMNAANSEDCLHSDSPDRSSSLSLSQNSPSIPAEGDWVEAADLDGERWVKAEDMDDMWGEGAMPQTRTRVNNLDTYPDMEAPHHNVPPAPAVDFNVQSRVNSSTLPLADTVDMSAPSPKRARLSASPIRVKSADKPSFASHHALIPADPSADQPAVTLSSAQPASKEETLFTEARCGSDADSEDDTGSSGDVSASLRQLHAARQALALSPHSGGVAGSASGDDNLGSQEAQASSHGFDSDEESESSDGFEGVPSRYCTNCMSRMYLGDAICLVRPAVSNVSQSRALTASHASCFQALSSPSSLQTNALMADARGCWSDVGVQSECLSCSVIINTILACVYHCSLLVSSC